MNGADTAIGAAAAWAALCVAGYLGLGVLAAALERGAGLAGRFGRAGLRLYPPVARTALRAGVAAVVGLGSAAVDAAPASAMDAGAPPSPPRPPVVASSVTVEPLDWPVATTSPAPRAPIGAATVVVRPGDCLWSLTARALGPTAPATAVAAEWPRWWAANRDVIGDDPGLLRPGLRLHPPVDLEGSTS